MPDRRVVVVGTTTDYIDLIARRFPSRAIFMTDPRERANGYEAPPDEASEVLCDLTDSGQALAALHGHIARHGQEAVGVACFDCESLLLAAAVAESPALPISRFPTAEAIANSRNKYLSKKLWHRAGLPCPETTLVRSANDAVAFLEKLGHPAVMKPLTGSGSELVFLCRTADDCARAFAMSMSRLATHPNIRMYASSGETEAAQARQVLVIEEFIEGEEYSCDFVLGGGRLDIIRIARKIPAAGAPLGTIAAYLLPAELPDSIPMTDFQTQVRVAAEALGITRTIGMLDFIIRGGRALMIEMTPRPGGDCLPFLIRQSCGLDMLELTLDFAEGRPVMIPEPTRWRKLVGVRLFADKPGIIRHIDDTRLRQHSCVVESYLKRRPGHRVILPPADYDSRLLGHVIFVPSDPDAIAEEAAQVSACLDVEMEPAP